MITSKLRGHIIILRGKEWFYKDTNTPTAGNARLCGHCGKNDTKEGHDGCLGALPGLMNACCGHGVTSDAYVQLFSGVCIRGAIAIEKIKALRSA